MLVVHDHRPGTPNLGLRGYRRSTITFHWDDGRPPSSATHQDKVSNTSRAYVVLGFTNKQSQLVQIKANHMNMKTRKLKILGMLAIKEMPCQGMQLAEFAGGKSSSKIAEN